MHLVMPIKIKTKMKKKAQSTLEYVVLVSIIAAALTAMQIYFKRGIQATVKLAADDMSRGMQSESGDDVSAQKKGAVDYDYKYEWKWKGDADTFTSSTGVSTTEHMEDGAVSYGKNDTTTQTGVLSAGAWQERE